MGREQLRGKRPKVKDLSEEGRRVRTYFENLQHELTELSAAPVVDEPVPDEPLFKAYRYIDLHRFRSGARGAIGRYSEVVSFIKEHCSIDMPPLEKVGLAVASEQDVAKYAADHGRLAVSALRTRLEKELPASTWERVNVMTDMAADKGLHRLMFSTTRGVGLNIRSDVTSAEQGVARRIMRHFSSSRDYLGMVPRSDDMPEEMRVMAVQALVLAIPHPTRVPLTPCVFEEIPQTT